MNEKFEKNLVAQFNSLINLQRKKKHPCEINLIINYARFFVMKFILIEVGNKRIRKVANLLVNNVINFKSTIYGRFYLNSLEGGDSILINVLNSEDIK